MLPLHLARLIIFRFVLLCSIVVLGISAAFIAFTRDDFVVPFTFIFTDFALAVAVISISVLVPVIIIDYLRQGVFTSMVAVELAWSGVLWVLWLASGALAASGQPFADVCIDFVGEANTLCTAWPAITAFSFLAWIALMAWWITLMVFAARGNHWTNYTTSENIMEAKASTGNTGGGYAPQVQGTPIEQKNETYAPTQYNQYPPPQQQQQFPQQGYNASPAPYPSYHTGSPAPAGGQAIQV